MKPTKNLYFCVNAGRCKMKFDSEKKALNFIKYNGDDVPNHRQPFRAYYCECCMGWHISKSYDRGFYQLTNGLPINEVRKLGASLRRKQKENASS